jgi:hypothetical protein
LRDSLPTIPIPLIAREQATLDLQSALHQAYDAAGYEDYIYASEPYPPLQSADAEWARQLIAAQTSSSTQRGYHPMPCIMPRR